MSELTVYKASAGSGKTFQLTSEYLKIIFKSPEDFRYILAVTFTHKATAEMKARILNELYNLSNCKETEILKILTGALYCSKEEIYRRAALILKKILHHYSQFHISTIDSFFQGIISSFARDLGLQANFTVELNSSRVLNAVVDNLLLKLEKDPLLTRWLIDFAEDKVLKGESWELKQEIQSLGNELFREEYAFDQLKTNAEKRKEVISNFRKKIDHSKKENLRRLEEIVKTVHSEISSAGLTVEDFSFGWNGVMGYLQKLVENPSKLAGSRVTEASNNPEKWASKSSPLRENILELAGRVMIALLKEAMEICNRNFTMDLLLSNIYSLGLMSDLQVSISTYAQEHNLFLLDQAPWLINKLMDSNDSPFIYEKTGNQFQYFMIDEFQDTSSLQWRNFLPLIENSLAQDKACMLVGDVKQSIYRWRNSSWKTLWGLKDEPNLIKVLSLDTNWRSRPVIVKFNNSLFSLASVKLQEIFDKDHAPGKKIENAFSGLIPGAYEELSQNLSTNTDDNSGYAGIRFIDKTQEQQAEAEEQETAAPEKALVESKIFIDRLLASNYRQKDIAILVRNKKEGTKIAEYLVNQKSLGNQAYRVISNDALYLKKSSTVKLIIGVIQWLIDDKIETNKLYLASEFSASLLPGRESSEGLLYFSGDELSNFLPAELVKSRERLKVLPLFDLVENIIFLLDLTSESGQYPYLQAFIDVVHDYSASESGNIPSFLDWWQENSGLFTISAPEEQDAIRIITIHKAKGLEFKAVILPFCKWNIDHKPPHMPILWCDTADTEFNELGLVPIQYKAAIGNSIFADRYHDEKIQTYVDNLNLLYVAFTRARDCLYAICELSGKTDKIGNLIKEVLTDPKGAEILKRINKPKLESFMQANVPPDGIVEFGSIPNLPSKEFIEAEVEPVKKINLPGKRIHIRAHTEEYFLPLLDPEREGKINRGLIIHQALSAIKTTEDIHSSLEQLQVRGLIGLEDLSVLETEMREMLKDPVVQNWFKPGWNSLNETGILERGAGIQRPDRVLINGNSVIVIDYKTGETENKKYEKQLERYMSAIRKMGYSDVRGYIWYLRLKKVVEVEEKR